MTVAGFGVNNFQKRVSADDLQNKRASVARVESTDSKLNNNHIHCTPGACW